MRVRGGGFAIVPNRIIKDPSLSHLAVRIFALLSGEYARGRATCYPSQQVIAHALGMSPRSERRIAVATRQLVAAGALTVTPRYRPDGKRRSNLYTLELCGPPATTRKRVPVHYAETRRELNVRTLKKSRREEQRSRERAPASSYRREKTPRRPEDNIGVITKIAHEVLDLLSETPNVEDGEVRDGIKRRCAALRIAYDAASVVKALESALVQRQRAGKRSPLAASLPAVPGRRVVPTPFNSVFQKES